MTTAGVRLVIAILMLISVPAAADDPDPPQATTAPLTVAERSCEAATVDFCARLCAPKQMVFLPCMAVGARAMAACREREIEGCRRACFARRGC